MSQIPVPLMKPNLQCRDTFAWPNRCPYKTGSNHKCIAKNVIPSLNECRSYLSLAVHHG